MSRVRKSMDFCGFQFNGVHSSELGILRVSNSSRYDENLVPQFSDKTAQIPGGDGMLYWDSFYTQKPFSINIAFDDLTELEYRRLRQVFNGRARGELIFDEAPYKAYSVKVQSPPQLKTLCFDTPVEIIDGMYHPDGSNETSYPTKLFKDECGVYSSITHYFQNVVTDSDGRTTHISYYPDDETTKGKINDSLPIYVRLDDWRAAYPQINIYPFGSTKGEYSDAVPMERVYKGEGTIQFISYYPYAISVNKYLDEFKRDDATSVALKLNPMYGNMAEWAPASQMMQNPYISWRRNQELGFYNNKEIDTKFQLGDKNPNFYYINLYNAGDVPTDWDIYFYMGVDYKNHCLPKSIKLYDVEMKQVLGQLNFQFEPSKMEVDRPGRLVIHSRNNLMEFVNSVPTTQVHGAGAVRIDVPFVDGKQTPSKIVAYKPTDAAAKKIVKGIIELFQKNATEDYLTQPIEEWFRSYALDAEPPKDSGQEDTVISAASAIIKGLDEGSAQTLKSLPQNFQQSSAPIRTIAGPNVPLSSGAGSTQATDAVWGNAIPSENKNLSSAGVSVQKVFSDYMPAISETGPLQDTYMTTEDYVAVINNGIGTLQKVDGSTIVLELTSEQRRAAVKKLNEAFINIYTAASATSNGMLFNQYLRSGDFFKIPVGPCILEVEMEYNNPKGGYVPYKGFTDFQYNYLYY